MIRPFAALLALAALFSAPVLAAPAADAAEAARWSIAIHGGAGTLRRENMTAEEEKAYRAALAAALDVFDEEPLDASSGFWDAPNTIVTPHLAGFGQGYFEVAAERLLENVARLERGEPRGWLVDRARLY